MLLRFGSQSLSVLWLCIKRISFLFALLSFTHAFAAKVDGLELSATDISRDYETRTVILEGDVRIAIDGERLTCQKASINLRKQEIIAEGRVTIESASTYIEGDKIVYNYRTKLGEIHKGYVQAGQVVFIGDFIEKNSPTEFLAYKATYTSCRTCPAAWSFYGQKIKAEIGGYASIKYPVFRVADVPIFILPKLLVPLKSTRQSGFLVPSLEVSSTGGTAVTIPYFWAISRSQDLTYSLKQYEKSGLKQKAEYRYVISEQSKGSFNSAYLKDKNFTETGNDNDTKYELQRGFLAYQHHYELPDGYVQRTKLNLVSDLRYVRDFPDEILGHGDPALENNISLTKNTENQHVSAEAAHYTNLLKSNADSDNSDAVHRFPEIKYSFVEKEILDSNLFFKIDFKYTNFSRRDFSYDDVASNGQPIKERDGTFNHDKTTGRLDLIRTGQRFIFLPTVSYPFHIGRYLDVNPSATYNSTHYMFNLDSSAVDINDPSRRSKYDQSAQSQYLQTDLSFKTKYSAVYGVDDKVSNRYKHEIEPEIVYSRIPYAQRPNHIFFGNFQDQPTARRNEPLSNSDVLGPSRVQFDYHDRFFDKDIATYVLSNHVIRKTYGENGGASYKKFVTFRLAQSYDFNQAATETDRPWSAINSLLDIRMRNFQTHTTVDYYPYAKVSNYSPRLRFNTDSGNYVELTYSNKVIVQEDQLTTGQRTETIGTGLGFKTKYLDFEGIANFLPITDELESWEYTMNFKPPGDCWALEFKHNKAAGSDNTSYKLNVNFVFSGI
jgi:LPS-assembly protein